MTESDAKAVLSVLPEYEVVDVDITSVSTKWAEADVTYMQNGGDLRFLKVAYYFSIPPTLLLEVGPEAAFQSMFKELLAECQEACLYHRDTLRSTN